MTWGTRYGIVSRLRYTSPLEGICVFRTQTENIGIVVLRKGFLKFFENSLIKQKPVVRQFES